MRLLCTVSGLPEAGNNKKLREPGYPAFTESYLKVCENEGTAVYEPACAVAREAGRKNKYLSPADYESMRGMGWIP